MDATVTGTDLKASMVMQAMNLAPPNLNSMSGNVNAAAAAVVPPLPPLPLAGARVWPTSATTATTTLKNHYNSATASLRHLLDRAHDTAPWVVALAAGVLLMIVVALMRPPWILTAPTASAPLERAGLDWGKLGALGVAASATIWLGPSLVRWLEGVGGRGAVGAATAAA